MVSREVGEELVYPSLAAACLTAAVVLLLSGTVGRFLMDHDAVERFIRDWLPFLPPFMQALPPWAREAPFIFGGIAVAAIVTVRLLAGRLAGGGALSAGRGGGLWGSARGAADASAGRNRGLDIRLLS